MPSSILRNSVRNQRLSRVLEVGTYGAAMLTELLLWCPMVSSALDNVTSQRSIVGRDISFFKRVWPTALLMLGFAATLAWTAFLANLFVRLVEQAF
jgi:hypothetical protein